MDAANKVSPADVVGRIVHESDQMRAVHALVDRQLRERGLEGEWTVRLELHTRPVGTVVAPAPPVSPPAAPVPRSTPAAPAPAPPRTAAPPAAAAAPARVTAAPVVAVPERPAAAATVPTPIRVAATPVAARPRAVPAAVARKAVARAKSIKPPADREVHATSATSAAPRATARAVTAKES